MPLRTRDAAFAGVFGQNLARCRNRLGISQEDLGFLAGLHRTAVGQLERGERVARTDTLVRLCGSLGVRPDALLLGLNWRPTRIEGGALEIEGIEQDESSEPAEAKRARKQRRKEPEDKTADSSEGQR